MFPLGFPGVPPATANVQEFFSSSIWEKPPAASFVLAELWAGGGGGANNVASSINLAGGSGGEYISRLFLASELAVAETVVIGAGGTPGANGVSAPGTVGGNTTFNSLTAIGGNPGTLGSGDTAIPRAKSSPVTGINAGAFPLPQAGYGVNSGSGGGNCQYGGAGGGGTAASSGTGGTSELGGNGGNGNNTLNVPATAGTVPGGGGGTSANDGGGGAGAAGYARITSW